MMIMTGGSQWTNILAELCFTYELSVFFSRENFSISSHGTFMLTNFICIHLRVYTYVWVASGRENDAGEHISITHSKCVAVYLCVCGCVLLSERDKYSSIRNQIFFFLYESHKNI